MSLEKSLVSPVLFPSLKPPDWDRRPHVVHQRLLPVDSPWMPWLTFLENRRSARVLCERGDPADLRRTASRNVHQTRFRMARVPGGELGVGFDLVVLDGEFAPEQILSTRTMRRVQAELGTDALLVGAPERNLLYCIDARLPGDQLAFFRSLVERTYFQSESGPDSLGLTPLSFVVADGELVCVGDAEWIDPGPVSVQVSLDGDVLLVRARGSLEDGVETEVCERIVGRLREMSGRTAPLALDVRFPDVARGAGAGPFMATFGAALAALRREDPDAVRVGCLHVAYG